MAARGGGSVFCSARSPGMRRTPLGFVGYTTAKAAINGMYERRWPASSVPSGVRVNCLVPCAIPGPSAW